MTNNVRVHDLLRFEAQRLGASIAWSAAEEPADTARSVRLVTAEPAPILTHDITLPDGDARRLSASVLADMAGGRTHSLGGVVVATSLGNEVRLAVDLDAIAEDGPLLVAVWDVVAAALGAAAEHVHAEVDQDQLNAFAASEELAWREALRRLPREIDDLEYAVSRLESQMREQSARLFELRCRHRAMQLSLVESVRAAARDQHAAVRRLMPAVYQHVAYRDGAIVATLGPVVIEHDGVEVEVGEFEIRVELGGGEISIRNMTHVVNGIHHPHVRGPQDVCWGNLRASIVRCVTEREWAGVLIAIHRFLHSYAEGDAYQALGAWDPDHSDDDESYEEEQEDDDEDNGETCSLCLEVVASDEVTWVRNEPVCLGCYERDVFTCACCRGQFTTRDQARESSQCSGCWQAAHFTCAECQQVKPVTERTDGAACRACAATEAVATAPETVAAEVPS